MFSKRTLHEKKKHFLSAPSDIGVRLEIPRDTFQPQIIGISIEFHKLDEVVLRVLITSVRASESRSVHLTIAAQERDRKFTRLSYIFSSSWNQSCFAEITQHQLERNLIGITDADMSP